MTQERQIVSYPRVFTTALPPRSHLFITDEQKAIAKTLPQNREELLKAANNPEELEKVVDSCAALIATRSQTSLSKKFVNQRLRYIKGTPNPDLQNPSKKLTVFSRCVRDGVAHGFEQSFQEFQQQRLKELKNHIRAGILEASREEMAKEPKTVARPSRRIAKENKKANKPSTG